MQIAVPSPAAGLPIPRSHSAPSATTRPEAHDVPGATAIPATVQRDVLVQPAVLPAPRMSLASDAGSAVPAQASAEVRHADAGSGAVAAGIAHRDADGSVVFALPTSSAPSPNVQRAVPPGDTAVDSPPEKPVDRPLPAPASAAPPTPTHSITADRPGGALDIDDLARRLYDPLAARLKAELRLDRERAGVITDLRRP